MATRRSSGPRPGEERKAALTCSVCLEIFTDPKVLPCLHTYCLKCIQDLASRHGGQSFACPQCRRDVTVPLEGVAAFPINFHILPEDLARARNKSMCFSHPDKALNVYCADCQQALCERCAMFKHKRHDIKELHEAADDARRQLQKDQSRLDETVSCLVEEVAADGRELQSARDKRDAMKAAIKRRHASLVSVVDKCRDDMLASLDAISADIEDHVTTVLEKSKKNLDQARELQQQLQGALEIGADHEALAVAKEMREGRGCVQALSDAKSARKSSIRRPGLSWKLAEDIVTPIVRDFLGFVVEVKMEITQPEVEVVEKFCCGDEDDTEIFSICPYGDGRDVGLSFARRGLNEDAPSEEFDEEGHHIETYSAHTGKVSCKSRNSAKNIVTTKAAGWISTYDKSKKKTIFCFDNNTDSHEGHITTIKVTSEDQFTYEETVLFTVSIGRHRAFDVDSTDNFFTVLEEVEEKEGVPGTVQRRVRLYRRGQRDSVATYRPPSAACRPSDVCFWQQPDGREILVVADEGTDTLHVLKVEDGVLRFEGYLAAASPLIVQPTALNTDTRGRLWVALRGGQVLTLTYVT